MSDQTLANPLFGVRIVKEEDTGKSVIALDLADIRYTEQRIADIQHVNPHKAPELLTVFNQAYLQLGEHIARLTYQENRAANELDKIKGRLLIDEIPAIIADKKLSNSKDIRDALISADPTYQECKDLYDQLVAATALLKGKQKSIEMAYTSVKKIIGENNYDMSSQAGRKLLNGILDDDKTAGQVQDSRMFGTPAYENDRR
jgi:hypothetical protein